jgi:long-chain acyl-CoA synthetase
MSYRNLPEVLRLQAERLGQRVAVRHKRHGLYHDMTWQQYGADALACAAALVDVGVRPGDRVGVLSENRLEWLIADMGLLAAAAVNVPPHAPLTAKQVRFQLEDAGVSWLFVSTREQLAKVLEFRASVPFLRGIVVFDAGAAGAYATAWRAFLQRGRQALPRVEAELRRREKALQPDDLATIMYTSGTTGNPKGVMLTHDNLLSNAVSTWQLSEMTPDTVVLNWLPFSHIYARTIDHYQLLVGGVTVCLAESADTLVQNLEDVRPTNMASVPRFYEKVLTAVASADPAETGRRLRKVFGPRIDWLSSGGAPLPVAIAQAYHAAGLLVLQGYGLTESSPVISFNRKRHYKIDTVGLPIPGVEVRIADDGEILSRGPHIMKGYWNNPDATAATVRDGWLYTGDLGELDADGFLKITGRKKELMVLSSGKKLVPNYIEGLLLTDPCFDQVVVYGEGRNFLTSLVVPHWENLRRELKAASIAVDGKTDEALSQDTATQAFLAQRMDAALKDVASWERVKKFVILPKPFTVAGDELTVSLKLRRNVVFAKYRTQLDAMYTD